MGVGSGEAVSISVTISKKTLIGTLSSKIDGLKLFVSDID